ncbi:unnamed protein product (macronuclear) [Paramecium tetraurelia]|uniref:Uncharacterized protein n=1 Tax=Paramecium tetraurelia TaxID=5888 RepID=A0EAE2_PARTE|nr:uncharacterized protein GSPATT00024991001 [Paramecium tetraurelia]CAK92259.1 unnamed protein product [Paramecium tetraurelia]|eukprot:XP_001459656.1 hypothetical protein (macronuclear) [Paramecium tetraurelia strain d4-2]
MIDYFIIFLFVKTIQPQFILDQVQVLNYEFNEKLELNPLFKRNCLNDRERLCKLHLEALSPKVEEIISIASEYLNYFGAEDPDQYQRLMNQIITQYVYRQDEYQAYALVFQGLRDVVQSILNIQIGINSKEGEMMIVMENTTKQFDNLITFENLYLSEDGNFIYTKEQEGVIHFNSSVNLGTIKMNSTQILASYFNKKKTLFKSRSMVELFGGGTEITKLNISAHSQIAYITFMIEATPLSPEKLKNKIHIALQQRYRQLHRIKDDFIEQFIRHFVPKYMHPALHDIIQNMIQNKPVQTQYLELQFIIDELRTTKSEKLIELNKLIEQLLQ